MAWCKCKLCGYGWTSLKEAPPKACPRCKRYDWQEDKKNDTAA